MPERLERIVTNRNKFGRKQNSKAIKSLVILHHFQKRTAVAPAVVRLQFIRAASAVAFRWAIASIDIMGLTPEAEGKVEPSIAYRLCVSQASPSGLVAEVFAEPPSRAVPWM